MIRIKVFKSSKKDSGSSGSSGSNTVVNNISSAADQWFVFDNDNNAVCCKYDFYSVGGITANASTTLTNSLGLTTAQIVVLQSLLSDANTVEKLQAIADKTTVANNNVTINATIAQQNP